MNKHYHNSDDHDGGKNIPDWFYFSYCDECEKYREFSDDICSHLRSHKLLITCHYCQNGFKTFNSREIRCSVCCQLIESRLKTCNFEKLKKLAYVCNIKRRRQECVTDELVTKVENYVS